MGPFARYWRLFAALARYSLAREMAFRANFLAKVAVEVLWLGILLIFYRTVFAQTSVVAGWSEPQYLFFVGCYFALGGVIETFFLGNCSGFADLVRSGDLDYYLLQPIDEQFLLTCRDLDWSTIPNIVLGVVIMGLALSQLDDWCFRPEQAALFLMMFLCGTAIAYSFLVLLMSTSVWMVRNQSLYELWWLFTSLMRYPREIFTRSWALPIGWFFTFVIPVIVVANVPAGVMVRKLLNPSSAEFDPLLIGYTALATLLLLGLSRWYFRFALKRYRSASS
jgi:ABC-2 type transport system permease protein